jgi:hypothetical protein
MLSLVPSSFVPACASAFAFIGLIINYTDTTSGSALVPALSVSISALRGRHLRPRSRHTPIIYSATHTIHTVHTVQRRRKAQTPSINWAASVRPKLLRAYYSLESLTEKCIVQTGAYPCRDGGAQGSVQRYGGLGCTLGWISCVACTTSTAPKAEAVGVGGGRGWGGVGWRPPRGLHSQIRASAAPSLPSNIGTPMAARAGVHGFSTHS